MFSFSKQTEMKRMLLFLWIVTIWVCVNADIYLHNPRGSNNRLNEAGRERNNANRLFDSQNNNRGGYNVGSLYFYHGSKLPIEWTNQHSCKSAKSHCEIVIQYICEDTLRDGTNTKTIPDVQENCENNDCNKDLEYGMHENYEYYLSCKNRQRNLGLYTADQNLKGDSAIYTRQNAAGTRYAYECPEERDYYPYWHPTPWKDIAVLTNDATRCPYYEEESENVKGRYYCQVPTDVMLKNKDNKQFVIPNNEEDCLAWEWPPNSVNASRAEWVMSLSHQTTKPACHEAPYSRDNHLGNGVGGYANTYNWTVPSDFSHENCAIRIRYNVSTDDYDGWNTDSEFSAPKRRRKNNNDAAKPIDMFTKYGFESSEEAKARGYEFKNNPEVNIFEELDDFKLRLALNTAQYGRVFQDRSHSFAIRSRPSDLTDVTIHNVNVRGKRGNIVQVYPAVEYDFVPNTLELAVGDFVHFQWTGSNTNPNNNDGQGRAGTDRSNVVLQGAQVYDEGNGTYYVGTDKHGHWGRSYPETIEKISFLGLTKEDLINLAILESGQFRGDMEELDDAGTYFDLGPKKVTSTGIFHYLCTRNNNFSNRSQKGRIIASDIVKIVESIGWNGGAIASNDGKYGVAVERGTFSDVYLLQLEVWNAQQGEDKMAAKGKNMNLGSGYASDYLRLSPEHELADDGKSFVIHMDIKTNGMEYVSLYRSNSDSFATWTKIDAKFADGKATFAATEGGVYVARTHANGGAIAGAVIGTLILVGLIVGAVIMYTRKNPATMAGVKRSFQARI